MGIVPRSEPVQCRPTPLRRTPKVTALTLLVDLRQSSKIWNTPARAPSSASASSHHLYSALAAGSRNFRPAHSMMMVVVEACISPRSRADCRLHTVHLRLSPRVSGYWTRGEGTQASRSYSRSVVDGILVVVVRVVPDTWHFPVQVERKTAVAAAAAAGTDAHFPRSVSRSPEERLASSCSGAAARRTR